MRKYWVVLLLVVGFASKGSAQEFGLSFSYFIPRNGDISTPISPFSFRGVGINVNRYFALETGITLYRMAGLGLRNVPFETKNSMVGPNFTFFVPAEAVIQFPGRGFEFDIKGGGFVFYGLNQKLNYGNIDRALAKMETWDVVNSDLSFKNSPGFGWHAGVELSVDVTNQFGVSIEVNYLMGSSALPLTGQYVGGSTGGSNTLRTASFQDAKVDFTGLEVSIGVYMTGGGGPAKKKKRR